VRPAVEHGSLLRTMSTDDSLPMGPFDRRSDPRPDLRPDAAAEPVPWLVEVAADGALQRAGLEADGPDDLVEWLWMRLGDEGLVGIDEGSIDVNEAVAAGLALGPIVIDAAAAPPDRDWVAARRRATIDLAFADEQAARSAVALLADVGGLRVGAPRPAVAAATVPQEPVAVPGFGWVLPPAHAAAGVEAVAESGGRDAAGQAADNTRVFIDAGIGFGTGLHPTTRLCLRAIAAHAADGGRLDRVLDVGAGSGILGIAAAVLAAAAGPAADNVDAAAEAAVDAVEIDTTVHDAIRRNAALNGVSARLRIAATLGEVAVPPGGYDLVLANIVAPVLDELADTLAALVAPGGRLVLSGLLDGETAAIADRYGRLVPGRGKSPPGLFPGTKTSGVHGSCAPAIASMRPSRLLIHSLLPARPVVAAEGDWRCLSFAG